MWLGLQVIGGGDKVLMTPNSTSSSDSVEVSKRKHAHTDGNPFPNTPGSLIVFCFQDFVREEWHETAVFESC